MTRTNSQTLAGLEVNAVICAGLKSLPSVFFYVGFTDLHTSRADTERAAQRWRMKRECKCQMLMRLEKAEEELKRGGEAAERGGTASL